MSLNSPGDMVCKDQEQSCGYGFARSLKQSWGNAKMRICTKRGLTYFVFFSSRVPEEIERQTEREKERAI
jgi:hypothetical protein